MPVNRITGTIRRIIPGRGVRASRRVSRRYVTSMFHRGDTPRLAELAGLVVILLDAIVFILDGDAGFGEHRF